ncbi:MAG: DUF4249 family protein [Candidatus Neomarinimicrobiota bacterium]
MMSRLGLAAVLTTFLGCEWITDLPPDQSYQEKIVLNGILVAGTPIDSSALTSTVRVHRSADITEPYDDVSVALPEVTVTLDDGDSTYSLLGYEDLPGVWYHPSLIIRANATYTIYVSDAEHDPVTATTTVPSMLNITDITVDGAIRDSIGTITYKPAVGPGVSILEPIQFTFRIEPEDALNPPAMARVVATSLEASSATMITEDDSLKAGIFKWQGIPSDSLERRIFFGRTSTLNSINFGEELVLGWTVVRFYGHQNLSVFAMDNAYYNYHKGNIEGIPGDLNQVPESNVVGGYGLFSSTNLGEGADLSTLNWRLLRPGTEGPAGNIGPAAGKRHAQ